jgi:hypothetical protein
MNLGAPVADTSTAKQKQIKPASSNAFTPLEAEAKDTTKPTTDGAVRRTIDRQISTDRKGTLAADSTGIRQTL